MKKILTFIFIFFSFTSNSQNIKFTGVTYGLNFSELGWEGYLNNSSSFQIGYFKQLSLKPSLDLKFGVKIFNYKAIYGNQNIKLRMLDFPIQTSFLLTRKTSINLGIFPSIIISDIYNYANDLSFKNIVAKENLLRYGFISEYSIQVFNNMTADIFLKFRNNASEQTFDENNDYFLYIDKWLASYGLNINYIF